jgi:hypothetical protein
MLMRRSIIAAAALVLAAQANETSAADANASASSLSPIAAKITAGYATREADGTFSASDTYPTMLGEAAILYRLDDQLNLQGDYAYHEQDLGYLEIKVWHVGGALFQRDENTLYGIAATTGKTEILGPTSTNYVIGPIAEFYQENLTLGIRGNYVYVDYDGASPMKSGEISLYGIAYPADNLALKLAGTYANTKLGTTPLDTYVASAELEFNLVSNLSLFARAQYANQSWPNSEFEENVGLFGLRFYFGSDPESLKATHRSTTINNTIEWLENANFGS